MKGWKTIIWVLVILFINKSVIISLWKDSSSFLTESCEEYSKTNTRFAQHQRAWKDGKFGNEFCMSYEMNNISQKNSSNYKNRIKNPQFNSYPEFWGEIYRKLAQADHEYIKAVVDSLDYIAKADALDYTSFAHTVVKMVQDIPYQYILSEDCTSAYSDHPCYGNQRYGITSPVEFLYTLKGDCDSRTVLIYTILRHFNYDPVVLISKEYRHSMLALNIPAAGEYLTIGGEKYYFWETTATGWEPGIIPPGMDNKKYWDIALKHEL